MNEDQLSIVEVGQDVGDDDGVGLDREALGDNVERTGVDGRRDVRTHEDGLARVGSVAIDQIWLRSHRSDGSTERAEVRAVLG